MNIKLGIVMDPIGAITPHKDSSFAMLLEAQRRNWTLHYMEMKDLFLLDPHDLGLHTTIMIYPDVFLELQ